MEKIIVAEKTVESYLTKSKIGQFAINPYVGCPHAIYETLLGTFRIVGRFHRHQTGKT